MSEGLPGLPPWLDQLLNPQRYNVAKVTLELEHQEDQVSYSNPHRLEISSGWLTVHEEDNLGAIMYNQDVVQEVLVER